MPEVLVIGAGPVGLLLSAELRRRGVDVQLLEQRAHPGPGSRAIGIHPPVLAALEASGLTEELLSHALRVPQGEARSQGELLGRVHFGRLPVRFPFVATLPQASTEDVLSSASPSPERSVEVTAIHPGVGEVLCESPSGDRRAPLVVLAGGTRARSLVYRHPAAREYPDQYLMTDVEVGNRPDADTAVVHLDQRGVLESFPLPGGRRRFVAWDPPGAPSDPDDRITRLHCALAARGEPAAGGVSAFGVRRFVAPAMRRGRLFVIGDTAHEVSPIGGQGMNLGLLDAATLAPLLATWVRTGDASEHELHRWEQARIRSAGRAAQLAGLNTRLGRRASATVDAARRAGVRVMLGPGLGRVFAQAYAMGFDAHAHP